MVLAVRLGPDPLSEAARDPSRAERARIATAGSQAGRVLLHELMRYCAGEIQGRSFLVAGHRGAGKTTTVADVITQAMAQSETNPALQRPLPVLLHGPSLFGAMPETPETRPRTPSADSEDAVRRKSEEDAQRALTQLILGLHRAVVREYARAYRERARSLVASGSTPGEAELGELAAQFELELMEDPPAARLREFWDRVDALQDGVLLRQASRERWMPGVADAARDQGARELVALNGICNAHQRISGELSGAIASRLRADKSIERSVGLDLKLVDVLKPASVALSGALVFAGSAAGGLGGPRAALFGALAAVASGLVLKGSTAVSTKREREVDRKFIPDLSVRTLDRVLPTLLERLREAGLAPVFVIDELDKVDGLSQRILSMVHHLKKLFAENVFTCFLTDRGYFEYLGRSERRKAYGVAYSYFQHPLLVAHTPGDFDAYLDQVLEVPQVRASPTPGSPLVPSAVDQADKDILKWVLRHRAQMHALNLNRELVAMRNEAGYSAIPVDALREKGSVYSIDATFQVAIEHTLYGEDVPQWLLQNARLRQTLFDALYFISRAWRANQPVVDLRDEARDAFRAALVARMNLGELGRAAEVRDDEDLLNDDEIGQLYAIVRRIAVFLSGPITEPLIKSGWPSSRYLREGEPRPSPPSEDVLKVLMLGGSSLLVSASPVSPHTDGAGLYEFRWRPSGRPWKPEAPTPRPAPPKLPAPPRVPSPGRSPAGEEEPEVEIPEDRYFASIDASFFRLMALSSSVTGTYGSGCRMLSDEAGVLPKTPPWRQAVAAITVIREGRLGKGSEREVAEAVEQLDAFVAMLRQHLGAVAPALAASAALAGLMASEDRAGAMFDALLMLSAGLQFAEADGRAVQSRVERFLAEWTLRFPKHPPPSLPAWHPGGSERPSSLKGLLAGYQRARTLRAAGDTELGVDRAWRQLTERLTAMNRQGLPQLARFEELVCAAAQRGPGQFVRLRLEETPLEGWTRLLLAGVGVPVPGADGKSASPPPPALVPQALLRLGLSRLAPEALDALCERLQALTGQPASYALVVRQALEDSQARLSSTSALGSLVVVRSPAMHQPSRWTQAPQGLVTLVLEASLLQALAKDVEAERPTVLDLLPAPVSLRWVFPEGEEPPRASRTMASRLHTAYVQSIEAADWQRLPELSGPRGAEVLLSLGRAR